MSAAQFAWSLSVLVAVATAAGESIRSLSRKFREAHYLTAAAYRFNARRQKILVA